MVESRKEYLERVIPLYSTLYYLGRPVVSDESFNDLLDELREVHPESAILTATGWGASTQSSLVEVPHIYVTADSINDRRRAETINAQVISDPYYAGFKADGLTVVLYYKDGVLERALTRGDGKIGSDITHNVLSSGQVPVNVDKRILSVRGEGILSYEDFEKVSGDVPRNKAAGIYRSLYADENEVTAVSFVAFTITATSTEVEELSVYEGHLNMLADNGFDVVPNVRFNTLAELPVTGSWDMTKRENLTYQRHGEPRTMPVDGAVLTREGVEVIHEGDYVVYNTSCIALKYPEDVVSTKVIDIRLQFSPKTKRLVPVANLEPVKIDNSIVSSVTLNNYLWLTDRGVGPGAVVQMKLANGIIPNLVSVSEKAEFVIPEEYKGSKITLVDGDMYAYDVDVSMTTYWMLVRNIKVIKGFGDAAFKSLISAAAPSDWKELHSWMLSATDEHIKSSVNRRADLAIELVTAARDKKFFFSNLVSMANLPEIGGSTMDRIRELPQSVGLEFIKTGVLPAELRSCLSNYLAVQNLTEGHEFIKDAYEYFDDLRLMGTDKDWLAVKPAPVEVGEVKGHFCMTGRFEVVKAVLAAEFLTHGWVNTDMGPSVKYLLNDDGVESSKIKKARASGITVISSKDFRELIMS